MNTPWLAQYRKPITDLLPALACGLIAFLAYISIGNTPVLRALGLALAIVGVALTLRQMGAALSVTGGLAVAFCGAFWAQTSGSQTYTPDTIVFVLGLAGIIAGGVVAFSQRPYVVLVIALAVFAVLFYSQIGIARSLRLNVLTSAWLIYLLFNAIMETNPRPDGPPPARLSAQYRAGILLLIGIGIINDPLTVLFTPAVALGLVLSKTRIPLWYWGVLGVLVALGIRGVYVEYVNELWWGIPLERVVTMTQRPPYLVAEGFRAAERWIDLFVMISNQFTPVGLLLGIVGLARMARWYPVLGIAMMLIWGAFFTFGLMYFGRDRQILILPLFIVQGVMMTYAVYALGQWVSKTLQLGSDSALAWVTPALYVCLPALMFYNIVNGV